MLWDIHDFSRRDWEDALQGNWETKAKSTVKHPNGLKYYMDDHYTDKLPMMRFAILGDAVMDEDYGRPLRPVLAIAEFKQFDVKNDPHGWSMPYITVEPSIQKAGVARELFRHALQWLKENDPDVVVHRTANSATGMHWQHVADTELFAAKVPWTQGERSMDDSTHPRGKVHMTDFESPTARMVDALQRKSAQDVVKLLQEHPAHDWSAPNGAFVHPLRAALMHLPQAVPELLAAGAKPAVEAGWIGHKLIDDHKAFKAWLDCFEEVDQGKAFVVAVTGHRLFINTHPAWDSLSEESKAGAAALAQESGTFTMRGFLGTQPTSEKEAWTDPWPDPWTRSQWSEVADKLQVRTPKRPVLDPHI